MNCIKAKFAEVILEDDNCREYSLLEMPLGRLQKPEEVVVAAAFKHQATLIMYNITGEIIAITAGICARALHQLKSQRAVLKLFINMVFCLSLELIRM